MDPPRRIVRLYKTYRGMEQLVARRAHNPKVTGSSPVPATKEEKSSEMVTFFILRHSKALENKGILRKKSLTFRVR